MATSLTNIQSNKKQLSLKAFKNRVRPKFEQSSWHASNQYIAEIEVCQLKSVRVDSTDFDL